MTSRVGTRSEQAGAVRPILAARPGLVILTATSRLAREIRTRHDREQIAAGRSGWPSPDILPFDAWVRRLWQDWLYSGRAIHPPRLLPASAERAVWEDIVRSSDESGELLDLARTVDVVLEAWRLACRWELPLGGSEWNATADTEAFLGWAWEFERRARLHGWLSGARLSGFVAGRVGADEVDVGEEVLLAGFDELPPASQRLLNQIQERGTRIDMRDGWWGDPDPDPEEPAVRIGFPSRQSEVVAAAAWARATLDGIPDEHDDVSIGIVVPDLRRYRDRIERVFSEEFEPGRGLETERDPARLFHISLGSPLSSAPLVDSALLMLRIRPDSIPIEAASRLLRLPQLGGAGEEHSARALLVRLLAAEREPRVSAARIETLAGDPSSPGHSPLLAARLAGWTAMFESLPTRAAPSEWASILPRLLEALGWPGDRTLSSAQYQAAGAWNERLSELASLDASVESMDLGVAVGTLDRMARSRSFQPLAEPAPVQVLGLLEAGGLRFDHLWVMGMDREAWPAAPVPNPFLPLGLQRRQEVPDSSPARALEFAGRLTSRLMRSVRPAGDTLQGGREAGSGPRIVVSYPERDGDLGLGPSPLCAALPEVDAASLNPAPGIRFVERIRQSSRIEVLAGDRGPRWNRGAGQKVSGGTAVLADQAACPFRGFARARLGTRARSNASLSEALSPGFDMRDRGLLLHDVLERVWGTIESHERLAAMGSGEVAVRVREAVAAAIRAMSPKRSVLADPGFRSREEARLVGLVGDWLRIERGRAPFRVVGREVAERVEIAGLGLQVRVDRIDELPDGSRILIDYKTRPSSRRRWDGDRPDEPQLPIYATQAAAGSAIAGVLFGVVRKGASGFRGHVASDSLIPDLAPGPDEPPPGERIPVWRQVLERLGSELREGVAVVEPTHGAQTCRLCDLQALCRVHEQPGASRRETLN